MAVEEEVGEGDGDRMIPLVFWVFLGISVLLYIAVILTLLL